MNHAVTPEAEVCTLGIDISKDTLDAHRHPERTVRRFANERAGHAALIAWATPMEPKRIVFEATRRYHLALEMALGKAGLPAVKINPLQARGFAEATGRRVKTDPIGPATVIAFLVGMPELATMDAKQAAKPGEPRSGRRSIYRRLWP